VNKTESRAGRLGTECYYGDLENKTTGIYFMKNYQLVEFLVLDKLVKNRNNE